MLETLVSVLVLTMGLLGHAALSIRALAANDSSGHRAIAAVHATFVSDLMRANRQQSLDGEYDIEIGASPSGGSSRANDDLALWKALLARLPAGDGSIRYDRRERVAMVVVRWDDARGNQSTTETSTYRTYEYSFRP
jgi:type IV pilus assembly protein PilV